MNNQTETFQRFGKAFQEKFCHLMLSDRPFCDQVAEVLNVEFLDYEKVLLLNLVSKEFYNKHVP